MAAVVFDLTKFRTRYPEFSSIADAQLSAMFDEAGLYLDNTASSIVSDENARLLMLNMITAHLIYINFGSDRHSPSDIVGALASGSEGSVSFSANAGPVTDNNAWFLQTPYGAEFWAASRPYRTFRIMREWPSIRGR